MVSISLMTKNICILNLFPLSAISAVEDIDVLNTNQGLLVSWAPIVKGLCEVTYTVSNFNGETTTEYLTDSTSYFVTRTDCVENKISVQGTELSTGITSEITTVTVDVDIGKCKRVVKVLWKTK